MCGCDLRISVFEVPGIPNYEEALETEKDRERRRPRDTRGKEALAGAVVLVGGGLGPQEKNKT
jgi:hypothetical protein